MSDKTNTYWPDTVAHQAAVLKTQGEEIERLRRDLANAQKGIDGRDQYIKLADEACDELRAEVEQLRALIQDLRIALETCGEHPLVLASTAWPT